MSILTISAILQLMSLPVPVIDTSKALEVRPISGDVVTCASPDMLPLVRLAAKSADAGGPDYGLDDLMKEGGCLRTINTTPFMVDFQEDVVWAGALAPPKMLRGKLRLARGRLSKEAMGSEFAGAYLYFYVAVDDLQPKGSAR